jgi:hypothetical protein
MNNDAIVNSIKKYDSSTFWREMSPLIDRFTFRLRTWDRLVGQSESDHRQDSELV